jgi:hypothetical protein
MEEAGKYYIFETLCCILITNQNKLIEEGKLGGKNQSYMLKRKGKLDPWT